MGLCDDSSISWTICKQCASRCRQITSPTPRHSIFTGQMLFLSQQCQSAEGTKHWRYMHKYVGTSVVCRCTAAVVRTWLATCLCWWAWSVGVWQLLWERDWLHACAGGRGRASEVGWPCVHCADGDYWRLFVGQHKPRLSCAHSQYTAVYLSRDDKLMQ